MKKILLASLLLIMLACVQETYFPFDEVSIEKKEPVNISVIYPKLEDNSNTSSKINKAVEATLAEQIAFFQEDTDSLTLDGAITQFENRFISFKNDFEADATPWEVNINSEVIFQSINVITISIDSYTFTGGAHGNSVITLLNFNPKTGHLYSQDEMLKPSKDFVELVKRHFNEEMASKNNGDSGNYVIGDDFKLPENIGFNEEGVIFLYNNYELTSFADGITEFTIPYSEVSKVIKINY